MSVRDIKFRGKTIRSIGVDYAEGNLIVYAEGNLIVSGDECFIVGEVVEANDEHITLEWWEPVYPETVEEVVHEAKINMHVDQGEVVDCFYECRCGDIIKRREEDEPIWPSIPRNTPTP